jgi:Invasion associated locus B (IalB) protein
VIRFVVIAAISLFPSLASARESLGLFGAWAAFQDRSPTRVCYAIAEPTAFTTSRPGVDRGRPFLTIAIYPKRQAGTPQLHVNGGYVFADKRPIDLAVGARRFQIFPQWNNAWAAGPRMDRAIITAMRRADQMTLDAVSLRGTRVVDRYSLDGFSAALDAAQAACRS